MIRSKGGRVINADTIENLTEILREFTHKELKEYAKILGVKPGKTKVFTALYLRQGGATVRVFLGD